MLRMSEYREINESRNTRYDGFSRTFIRIVKSNVSWLWKLLENTWICQLKYWSRILYSEPIRINIQKLNIGSRKLAFKIIDTCKIFIYCLLFQVVDCVNCLSPLSAYQAYGYLAVYWVPGGPVRALSTQQQATSVTVSLWTAAARPAWPVSQTCSLVCSPSPFGWPRRKLNFQRIALNLNSKSLSQFIYFIISPSICALIFPKLHK